MRICSCQQGKRSVQKPTHLKLIFPSVAVFCESILYYLFFVIYTFSYHLFANGDEDYECYDLHSLRRLTSLAAPVVGASEFVESFCFAFCILLGPLFPPAFGPHYLNFRQPKFRAVVFVAPYSCRSWDTEVP